MALGVGMRLGPYEILSPAGAGGMGEVYRARDTRLDRTVAVKVLATRLGDRPELHKRFEREARAISKLAHPHICTLFDIGEQEGTDFLVMEYLEGETLAQRLQRGSLPMEQVLKYGMEIAQALETAHRQGIVHRDLKPLNIMLTKTGAKLMDFGLAKLAEQPAPVTLALSEMTTQAPPEKSLTEEGVIVGTFQYMAPEQLEGQDADARTDLFALGMVLYEMATGRAAFTGKTKASVIAAILSSEPPPISTLQPLTPPAFDRVVKTCLAKDPEERWQSAHDLASELKWIAEGGSQAGVPAPVVARRRHRERWAWGLAALLAIAAGVAIVGYLQRAPKPQAALRFEIGPPPGHSFTAASLDWINAGVSPDGRYLALQAYDASGKASLWMRPFDSFEARELLAVEGGLASFTWAPDSRSLVFVAGGRLQRIEVNGTPPENICPLQVGLAPVLSRSGDFLAMSAGKGPLLRFTADNCTPVEATTLDGSRYFTHMWPYFLPDGRHFLYAALTAGKNHEIWEGSLDSKEAKLVLRNASAPEYISPGWLLFNRHGILMAQAFDWKAVKLSGEPVQLVKEQLEFNDLYGAANYDASQTGLLLYQVQPEQRGRFFWFDRSGRQLGPTAGEPGFYFAPRISPDGGRLTASTGDPQTHMGDLWLYDFAQGKWTRLTFNPAPGGKMAVWSPDGRRLAYRSFSSSGSNGDLFTSTAQGGSEELLLSSGHDKAPTDWSRDGRFLLFQEDHPDSGTDLWVLDLASRKASPVATTRANETDAYFSPDGRWITYVSDESGTPEVYLQALSGGAHLQVSADGGTAPRWRADGREIYFLSPAGKLMEVEVALGPSPRLSTPRELFAVPPGVTEYQVARDGRFLLRVPETSPGQFHIHVVANWMAELKK